MRSFGLLGSLDVVLDGRHVHVPPGKRRVVLAALLLRPGQVVGVDELIELVGGSRGALQTTVGRLREDLGVPELVLTRPGGYLLDVRPDEVDVHRFGQLEPREALQLWRGRPFADIGSDALERDHVPALTEKYLATLEARIEQDLRGGLHEQLVPELRSLTRRNPTRERMWAQLIVALHRCDRQTEALQAYDDIRTRLAEELGLDPGRDLQKAHQQVLTADNRPRARNDLPGDIPDFAGRAGDLDAILAAVPSGCVAITAIDGMAGIGKTTLAVRAAHRLAPRFPDAQLFVDLHSYTEGVEPRTPSDALLALLTALGVPAQDIPDGLDARAARWRAEMAHRKALVVLDNAGSAAQVRPLLPGSGLVLVTSRRRLVDLDAAHTISLDVLSEEDSLKLLVSIAGKKADSAASREIVRLCGYLPLAVRIVGARWRTRPAWSAQDVTRRLAEHRLTELAAGERSVAGAFALSYQQLTPEQQRLFRRLGLHTGDDWDAHLAAAVIGSTRAEAERLLDELLDVHLVQQQENGRYRFHDLLADHAKASVEPEEKDETIVRILDHYLHGAAASALRIAPGRPQIHEDVTYEPVDPPVFATPVEALAWQEAERRNLKAAVYLAAYEGHYRYAWQLPHHFAHFLLLRGLGRERIEVQSVALAAARHLGDLEARAEALRGLGSAYLGQENHAEAEKHLQEALGLMRQTGNLRGEASTLGLLGMIARERQEFDKAMEHFQRGLVLMRQAGAPTGEANALQHIGIVHAERGQADEALAHLERSLTLLKDHGDVRSYAGVMHDIAYVHFGLFNDEECVSWAERSLAAYRESGDRRAESIARAEFAYWRYQMGDFPAVREMAREVPRLCRAYMNLPDDDAVLAAMEEIRDHVGQVALLVALSLTAEVDGRLVEALGHTQRCLVAIRSTSRWWSEYKVLGQLSTLHLALGNREAAVRYAEEAVAAAERLRQPRARAVAERFLATATAPAAPAS
ncbi:AfsR/SARP family transcriptional regulator [Lentzea flava]|uniref:SARP family transcriptional regulator n=1 Tax=Lentzea flava TaxID=103732 RepID=A0ABQ2UG77_9PSEU|nr:BTAD domain-containing putative transcriptional regulator [Lentzea flava]MCP2198340.1 DNA-binding transcriptional activator of the SARP family [Lentzea flava]GGU25146.1 SARP family transcriptional regulator [Lentzea flava]